MEVKEAFSNDKTHNFTDVWQDLGDNSNKVK